MAKETTEDLIKRVLAPFIKEVREQVFIKPIHDSETEQTDEEVLGIIISKFTRWDSDAILKVTTSALEDANFSDLASRVEETCEKYSIEKFGHL